MREVAEMLGVSTKTVYRLIESKQLTAYRYGTKGRWRIDEEAVKKLKRGNMDNLNEGERDAGEPL